MPLAILMRHGEAENNVNRTLVGRHLESHLTSLGRQQASEAALLIQDIPIKKIYASPVIRTIETAEIVSKILGISYDIDERLYEIDHGNLAGMNYEEIIRKHGNLFLKFYAEEAPTLADYGVESFSSVKERMTSLLDEIRENYANENILMITHLDPIKAAISALFHLDPEALYHIRNASLTILKNEDNLYSLLGVNVMNIDRYLNDKIIFGN
ncbi:MAG TPA: histidine phosphatase family protein [Nitrososphaeraceae archaeon]